jgi:hypothetical protein
MFKAFDPVEVPCPRSERWIPIECDFPEVFLEGEALTEESYPHCGQTVSIVPKTGRRPYRRVGE